MFNIYKMLAQQDGEGLKRTDGKLPPSARKLLDQIKDETISSIKIVRTPLNSITRTFANIITLGQFNKLVEKYNFDQLYHLSLWINDKYNLEKNQVINLSKGSPIKSNSEIQDVSSIPSGSSAGGTITFSELIDNTRNYMGDALFSNYNFSSNNCQDFLMAIFKSNQIGNESDRAFIKQDTGELVKEIPAISKVLANLATETAAVADRVQNGEGVAHAKQGANNVHKNTVITNSALSKTINNIKI